jgi:leader peptidase (prepilin peptidase) / N-methyltransferase
LWRTWYYLIMFYDFFLIFLVFFFGLCIGSFLNCFIYRLEKGESVLKGRSYCPRCQHTLAWYDLVPVASVIFLKGACRYCHKKISLQYPLVELLAGLVFVCIFLQVGLVNIPYLIFLLLISCFFIVIFVYDLMHYIIPDSVLFPALAITFLYQLITNSHVLFFNSLWAGLSASAIFLLLFVVSRGTWMGFGDVKLALLLGLLLGFPDIIIGFFLSFLIGAVIGMVLMLFKKKGLKSEIPFAPFLIVGTFIALFFGHSIIQWYLRFLNI